MTELKLEFAALEQKLRERDAAISQLHADARAASRAAKKAAVVHETRIAALQRQLDTASGGAPVGASARCSSARVSDYAYVVIRLCW